MGRKTVADKKIGITVYVRQSFLDQWPKGERPEMLPVKKTDVESLIRLISDNVNSGFELKATRTHYIELRLRLKKILE
jgi:hypothetical protein